MSDARAFLRYLRLRAQQEKAARPGSRTEPLTPVELEQMRAAEVELNRVPGVRMIDLLYRNWEHVLSTRRL